MKRGYTLIELMVAVGLFAIVMTIASGAYLLMLNINRQAQGIATGIDNLSFALEVMTRNIRSGSAYNCANTSDGNCLYGADIFYFKNASGSTVSYSLSKSSIQETTDGKQRTLTDPSVTVSSLKFYVSGVGKPTSAFPDYQQPRVTFIISGFVSSGAGRPAQAFTVETGATMRGTDI